MTLYAEIDSAAKDMYEHGFTGDLELHCGNRALMRVQEDVCPRAWRRNCLDSTPELISTLGRRIVLVLDTSMPEDEWRLKGKLNIWKGRSEILNRRD